MIPGRYDEITKRSISSAHTWAVQTPHHTVLVDIFVGNGEPRSNLTRFHNLNTDLLDRLASAGAHPEEVDRVLCTHLHADHCGWNTRLVNGKWTPTLPHAKHVFPRAGYAHRSGPAGRQGFNAGVFEGSVLPVIAAGPGAAAPATRRIRPGHRGGRRSITLPQRGKALFTSHPAHRPAG